MNVENRTIFEGDNLHILRGLDSETTYCVIYPTLIFGQNSAVFFAFFLDKK